MTRLTKRSAGFRIKRAARSNIRQERRAWPGVEPLEDRWLLAVLLQVNAAANHHAIDPNIYGITYAGQADLQSLNATLNRQGGTPTSTYNWQQNASNRGNDFYYESLSDGSATAGAFADDFVSTTQAGRASPVLTVPTLDWIAKLGPGRSDLASFSTAKYANQQTGNVNGVQFNDPNFPTAAQGVLNGGTFDSGPFVQGNDPNDAYVANSAATQQAWVNHLVGQFGAANNGGVRYYGLDNEPGIWHSQHRDVHPVGATLDEVRDKMIAYASAVRAADPAAVILGPEEWNYGGYFYSGYDAQYNAAHNFGGVFPDRDAHGGAVYIPYLLQQFQQYQQNNGTRLLDYLSLHYYPQGDDAGHQEFSDDVSSATQLLRNVSTRSLWDANYQDARDYVRDIDGPVQLIPRIKSWVNQYYPGTKTALTEYNWGAEGHMNGATTQADLLGIFGREGLDMAIRWVAPNAGTPTYDAFKMYRNYDGNKSTFGNTSVSTTVPNPDQVSAFSAVRSSDGALTVMVINKNLVDPQNLNATTDVTINLSNFNAGNAAQTWRLAAVNQNDLTQSAITHLADTAIAGGSLTVSMPMQSVELFVIPPMAVQVQHGTLQLSSGTYSVNENGGNLQVTVSRTNGSDGAVSVNYATSNGTATSGSDYTLTSGTLNLAAGQTTNTFNVPILDDALVEGDETFNLTLSAPGGGAVLGAQTTAIATITDNDVAQVAGSVSFSGGTYSVGEAGGSVTITVNRAGGSAPFSVDYATSNGTATAGSDYTAASGTLSFGTGENSKTFSINITNDANVEGNETINLALSSPTAGATLANPSTATVTINDDDSAGSLQFSSGNYSIGESGGAVMVTVTRSGGTSGAVSVDYSTSNGTATAGSDYTAANGTLNFANGQTSQSFTVGILNDAVFEPTEAFNLTLSSPGGGAVLGAQSTALVNVTDDDVAPVAGSVSFSSATYAVGEAAGTVTIAVNRSGGTLPFSVNYTTSLGTAGLADYTPAFGTLSFGTGENSKTFTVGIIDDAIVETSESFGLALSNPTAGATLASPSNANVTINDNDVAPVAGSVRLSSATYAFGESGGLVTLTLIRSGGTLPFSVNYATSDGSAVASSDFIAASSAVNFGNGENSRTFTIDIINDAIAEGTESFNLALSSPTAGATLAAPSTAIVTIIDDDNADPGTLQFSAGTYTVGEGDGSFLVTVTRTGGSAGAVSVDYATSDGSATAGSDYTAASGTLEFAAGQVANTFAVPILDDLLAESDETINLALSSPTGGAALGLVTSAVLSIVDNDSAGTVQFSSATYSANEGGGSATITVTRTGGAAGGVSVDYATSDGTATDGSDYTAASGTLTFGPGQTSQTFTVDILDDLLSEPDETVNLLLSSPTGGAALGDASATLTITDNDSAVVVDGSIVIGAGPGRESLIQVFGPDLSLRDSFVAYDPSFHGGVRVAVGDVNGDGVQDIITAPGAGMPPQIKVFDGRTGQSFAGALGSFLAYSSSFHGGVYVAAGDVNGDGTADIITGPDRGLSPNVRVFSGADGTRLASFFGFEKTFLGGVRVAAGDVNGDGKADIITGSGPGTVAEVKVFNGKTRKLLKGKLASILPNGSGYRGGVYVAAGDLNGDGKADIVTAPDKGTAPVVRVFSGGTAARLASFRAYGSSFTGGVRVAVGDFTGDGVADIITAPGPGLPTHVRVFSDLDSHFLQHFLAFDDQTKIGLYIGASGSMHENLSE